MCVDVVCGGVGVVVVVVIVFVVVHPRNLTLRFGWFGPSFFFFRFAKSLSGRVWIEFCLAETVFCFYMEWKLNSASDWSKKSQISHHGSVLHLRQ